MPVPPDALRTQLVRLLGWHDAHADFSGDMLSSLKRVTRSGGS